MFTNEQIVMSYEAHCQTAIEYNRRYLDEEKLDYDLKFAYQEFKHIAKNCSQDQIDRAAAAYRALANYIHIHRNCPGGKSFDVTKLIES